MPSVLDTCPVCGEEHPGPDGRVFSRLWVYTNYDCNLSCTYCLVSSSPRTARRGFPLDLFKQLIDEACDLGFSELFLTGGEPALLPHTPAMIAYALPHMPVTMLSDGMLWKGPRLDRLEAARDAVGSRGLTLQISLDSGTPALHDRYRGAGTWAKTVAGIQALTARGFHVRSGTTASSHTDEEVQCLRSFLSSLGIPEEDQITRYLLARGRSTEGVVLSGDDMVPELTVDVDGVYWHPVMGEDLRITTTIFPLRDAALQIGRLWHTISWKNSPDRFHCG